MNSDESENRPEDSAPQDEQQQQPKPGNDDANKLGKFAQYTAPALLAILASTRPSAAVSV
jgi:hypothetical protein